MGLLYWNIFLAAQLVSSNDLWQGSPVESVAWSPNGSTLVSGSDDYTVQIWDPIKATCLKTLTGHNSFVWSVMYSPDGNGIASSSDDDTVKVWDVATGKCLHTLVGHGDDVRTVVYNPNGTRLASGSDDHTIKLWNPKTGECLQTPWTQKLCMVIGLPSKWRTLCLWQCWPYHQDLGCNHQQVFANFERSSGFREVGHLQSRWQATCLWKWWSICEDLECNFWRAFAQPPWPYRLCLGCCLSPRWEADCICQFWCHSEDLGCWDWEMSTDLQGSYGCCGLSGIQSADQSFGILQWWLLHQTVESSRYFEWNSSNSTCHESSWKISWTLRAENSQRGWKSPWFHACVCCLELRFWMYKAAQARYPRAAVSFGIVYKAMATWAWLR